MQEAKQKEPRSSIVTRCMGAVEAGAAPGWAGSSLYTWLTVTRFAPGARRRPRAGCRVTLTPSTRCTEKSSAHPGWRLAGQEGPRGLSRE
ncbi:hypothetical protein GCM10010193_44050 [Kitasatospora atroaurantiaca]